MREGGREEVKQEVEDVQEREMEVRVVAWEERGKERRNGEGERRVQRKGVERKKEILSA